MAGLKQEITMARLCKHHQELVDGKGKCSVPMWAGGTPAGFCDNDAYGPQTKENARKFDGYVTGLECFWHGGPKRLADVAHQGDPCIFCGIAHDDVPSGFCLGHVV